MPECLNCGETNFNNNPIFCNTQCKDEWKQNHELSLSKKVMVPVGPITWIMVSKGRYKKERKAWKKWMAEGRKNMKNPKEEQEA